MYYLTRKRQKFLQNSEKPWDLHVHLNKKWKNELNCKIEEQSWTKFVLKL